MKRDEHPYHKNKGRVPAHLSQQVAAPSLTGLRQVWTPSTIANGLTPMRLAMILRGAEMGNIRDQLELAEAMEERDPHYGSVLRTRRLAIQGLETTVESYSDEPRDIELADAVRDLVRRPEFDDLVDDLTDALGKGFSAVEMLWQTGTSWTPQYAWCYPTWFVWDRETGRKLRLLDNANPTDGIELGPNKWIVHIPRLKSGLPARSGLARLAAVAYMCKSWTIKDWMSFADTYGLPLRVGKYGPGASAEDIQTLVTAISNIASDAGAVIPESMMIEFVQATSGLSGGNVMFEGMADYFDKQMSKAVLGHSGSSDSTAGKLGGEDQADEVRLDILQADAKQLAATLNRDLVRPFIDFNFGVQENYPMLCIPVPEPEDIKLLVECLDKLVPMGLEVEESWARDKIGAPDPERDAAGKPLNKLLTAPKAAQAPAPEQYLDVAMNRQKSDARDELDGLVDRAGIAVDRAVEDWVLGLRKQIDEAITEGRSLEELSAILLQHYDTLDPRQFTAIIGEAMATAHLAGRAEVAEGE